MRRIEILPNGDRREVESDEDGNTATGDVDTIVDQIDTGTRSEEEPESRAADESVPVAKPKAPEEHRFQGHDFKKCKKCGSALMTLIHKPSWMKRKRSDDIDDLRTLARAEEAELETRAMGGTPTDDSPTAGETVTSGKKKHLFAGGNLAACAVPDCQKPVTDDIHKMDA